MSSACLPHTDRYWTDIEPRGCKMEFRLVYKGALRSGQSRQTVDAKHLLRKHFHKQLSELWLKHPMLSRHITGRFIPYGEAMDRQAIRVTGFTMGFEPPNYILVDQHDPSGRPFTEIIADDHSRCGFRFIPLVRRKNEFTCALNIIFLRRGHPGEIYVSGDIDNRIKTLLDGLRMPRECSEVNDPPEPSENPFYCLLEDDSLITSLQVTTDRLLTPATSEESKWEVDLVIHVTVVDPNALLGTNHLI